jgi:HAD superfamily phosphoserine phosphatase-like hydrolase
VKKRLVLFDFDGTLTTKDTFLEFIKFYHGNVRFYFGMAVLSPVLVAMVLKLIPNWRAKEIVLTWFFKNVSIELFNKKCVLFCTTVVPSLIRLQGLEAVRKYQLDSDVVVVSASPENWVAPWCIKHDIACIATRLELDGNKATGKLSGPNCFGPEKVKRILEKYDLSIYTEIIAFGDSRGDLEMLELARESYYKPFR